MVKYIGIKTAVEAKQINEEFLQKAQKHNKRVKTWRNLIVVAVIITVVLVVWVACDVFHTIRFMFYDVWPIVALVFVSALLGTELAMLKRCIKNIISTDDCWKPIAYQFFKATDGYTILRADICKGRSANKRILCLAVKDNKDEVSVKCIRNFKYAIRQDIQDIIVDLGHGIIYEPCVNVTM